MGILISKLMSSFSYFQHHPARILMLGLDAAGKSTILYKIKLNETVSTIPTIGFNVEEVAPCKGLNMTVWDVGGQEKIRQLWYNYFQNSEGLVFVIDSSDPIRFDEAKDEFWGILNHNAFPREAPVVILANKQDMPGAASSSQIMDSLQLQKLVGREWFIQSSCAITGDGLFEGFQQLADMVKRSRKTNSSY